MSHAEDRTAIYLFPYYPPQASRHIYPPISTGAVDRVSIVAPGSAFASTSKGMATELEEFITDDTKSAIAPAFALAAWKLRCTRYTHFWQSRHQSYSGISVFLAVATEEGIQLEQIGGITHQSFSHSSDRRNSIASSSDSRSTEDFKRNLIVAIRLHDPFQKPEVEIVKKAPLPW